MKYNFDNIIERKGTNSFKWDAKEILIKIGKADKFDDETIPLFVADMDFECSKPILEALRKTVDQKIFGYTTHTTSTEYYNAIKKWFKQKQDWEIKDEEIVYCPGTVHALIIAIRAFTNSGDNVIIQQPVYPPFYETVVSNGRNVVNNELINNEGFYTIDFEDLETKAKDPKTTLMFISSPHNPVGRIWTKEELSKMAKICNNNNVILISDEIHSDLIRKDQTFNPISSVDNLDNVVVCTAINKTFNLAGLHCSNIVIKNKLLRKKFQNELGHKSPSPFEIAALIAAYNESEDWLEQLNDYIDGNFDFLETFLKEKMPKIKYRRSDGTYLAWLDFSEYGLSPEEIHKRIYTDANVILQDGKSFGEKSSQFQRICLPSPRSFIEEAMERISRQF